MDPAHLTPELLIDLAAGRIESRELLGHLARHLLELCPSCRQGYATYLAVRHAPRSDPPPRPDQTLAVLQRFRRELERARREAERDFQELDQLEVFEARRRVRRARSRFRSPLLAERLLEQSRLRLASHPGEAYELAHLAHDVALRMRVGGEGLATVLDVVVRARAQLANALRVDGDLVAADRTFSGVLRDLREVADAQSRAEVLLVGAALRRDQRRFSEALELAALAARRRRRAGDLHLAAAAEVERALVLRELGEAAKAAELLRRVVPEIDRSRDPALHLRAEHDRVEALAEAGRLDAAAELLVALEPLARQAEDPTILFRRRWLVGKIASAAGETAEAERALREVVEVAVARGEGFDAALAGVDLALLYARARRPRDVQRLAGSMFSAFRRLRVHREAFAALGRVAKAAGEEALEVELLGELRRYLEAARRDPALRFRGR